MKIAMIPIDNRPVCYQLPMQIAELDRGNEIFLPDINMMGSLIKAADFEGILNWLNGIKGADVIIISLDTIAYGGLIPSRRSKEHFFEIKSRIEYLKEILNTKNAKVYAFSSIMRISNNNINEEEKEYWSEYGKKIYEYSYNSHKLEKTLKNAGLSAKYKTSNIPDEILNDYLETRKRNFEINKFYVELQKQGVFDTLVFSKDDCSEFGLNVKEAEILKELSSDTDGIYIKTGADEIPLTLLSRALNKDKNIKIAVEYTNPQSINKISKYEDISVKDSVLGQIELAGANVTNNDEADMILLVNNFANEQGELVMNIKEDGFEGELKLPDKPYFIADILNANGSDNLFVKKLLEQNFKRKFYGYSAWNTTGNTLGCAASAALIYFCAKYPDEYAFKKLQMVRFLDDWAYQANVRTKIRDNCDNLTNDILKKEMEIPQKILADIFSMSDFECKYSFPWNRFFEIKID